MDLFELQLPENLENIQLPSPELVNYWRLAEERSFFIDTDIDETLTEFIKSIIYINMQDSGKPAEERKPITLYIYSYGGELSAAFALIAACEASITPVITVNVGVAMSAGLLIFLAGQRRYAFKHSQALIHSGSVSGMAGTYEQMAQAQAAYDREVKHMREYIMSRTSIPEKTFAKKKASDWYLSTDEQIEYGIANKVIESLEEIK